MAGPRPRCGNTLCRGVIVDLAVGLEPTGFGGQCLDLDSGSYTIRHKQGAASILSSRSLAVRMVIAAHKVHCFRNTPVADNGVSMAFSIDSDGSRSRGKGSESVGKGYQPARNLSPTLIQIGIVRTLAMVVEMTIVTATEGSPP